MLDPLPESQGDSDRTVSDPPLPPGEGPSLSRESWAQVYDYARSVSATLSRQADESDAQASPDDQGGSLAASADGLERESDGDDEAPSDAETLVGSETLDGDEASSSGEAGNDASGANISAGAGGSRSLGPRRFTLPVIHDDIDADGDDSDGPQWVALARQLFASLDSTRRTVSIPSINIIPPDTDSDADTNPWSIDDHALPPAETETGDPAASSSSDSEVDPFALEPPSRSVRPATTPLLISTTELPADEDDDPSHPRICHHVTPAQILDMAGLQFPSQRTRMRIVTTPANVSGFNAEFISVTTTYPDGSWRRERSVRANPGPGADPERLRRYIADLGINPWNEAVDESRPCECHQFQQDGRS